MRFLSHRLSKSQPVYGGRAALPFKIVKSLDNGDTCNVCEFSVQNHWGTHVDAPAHFFSHGQNAEDYPADFWHFVSPHVVQLRLVPSQIVEPGDWLDAVPLTTDLLLFRSGWVERRDSDDYTNRNPGLSPELGKVLRKRFPNLRVVGMDWISVSAYQKRALGRETHQVFLDPEGEGSPVLLVEDMDLSAPLDDLKEVWVVPLRIEDADSAPCTVIGVFAV